MIHALTIDVEDYHNVMDSDWLGRGITPPTAAVVGNTRRILEHLARRGVRGTFFILGEVAATFPGLIREIASAGHELGVHGYHHTQVFKLTPDEFRRQVTDAKKRIEDAGGAPAEGHRAPAFSIMPQTSWALDLLLDAGFRYDSSIFPIAGRRYGWPGFPPDIHRLKLESGRTIIEAPMSTVRLLGRLLPGCGGGYIRHFPAFVSRWAFRRVARERPAILYMHPYEIELGVPPVDTNGLSAEQAAVVRKHHRMQLRNRESVETKLLGLLDRFQFAPMREVIAGVLTQSEPRP